MFVRNCWYVAGWDSDVTAEGPVARTILNEPIVLYRASDGGLVAFTDRCCHRFAPLSMGRVEGDDLRCMYHGLKFDRTGRCVDIPGQDLIPQSACVKTYPVAEKHSWIWVWMGDPARADEALIPPAVGFGDPNWTLRRGHLDYEANYLLINDNLTDFTHLPYVHANSFGAGEEFARTRPQVSLLDRGVRIQRWVTTPVRDGADAPPHRREQGDAWQTYDFLAPGVLLMHTITCPVGTADRFNRQPPDTSKLKPLAENFTSQAVTPMTDRTSRYFFSWGPRTAPGSDALADAMLAVAHMAFGEDKVMIEAQQRVVDASPGLRMTMTSSDAAPMQMRAVIERLVKLDGDPAPAMAVAS